MSQPHTIEVIAADGCRTPVFNFASISPTPTTERCIALNRKINQLEQNIINATRLRESLNNEIVNRDDLRIGNTYSIYDVDSGDAKYVMLTSLSVDTTKDRLDDDGIYDGWLNVKFSELPYAKNIEYSSYNACDEFYIDKIIINGISGGIGLGAEIEDGGENLIRVFKMDKNTAIRVGLFTDNETTIGTYP